MGELVLMYIGVFYDNCCDYEENWNSINNEHGFLYTFVDGIVFSPRN